MAGGGMVKALNANETTTTPETQIPETTSTVQPPMSGGKGAGRVSPTVESRPMFQNQTPITPPPSTGGGGKGAGRVVNPSSTIPTTPLVSKEQFVNRIGPEPIPRGLDNPVFRRLGQQRMEDRQDMAYNRFINTTSAGGQEQFLSNPPINPANPPMINNLTTGTSITQEEFQNRMRPPQTGGLGAKAIFKQGGLIGLMRRR